MTSQPLKSILVALALATGLAPTTAVAQVPAPGFRLYGFLAGTETFLQDTNNLIIHRWQHAARPGVSTYMEPDGTLLRTNLTRTITNGSGGGLKRLAFDGTELWDFRYDAPGLLSHHDIERLPNGNVLMIAWEDKTPAEAIAAGRDPALLGSGMFRPDHIIEVEQTGPTTGRIVWEWHLWDHLVQDFDPAQANFGVVADHPERLDINFPAEVPVQGDFNHLNSIDYDPIHDWILVSSREQDEIWIIDHSTTTAEAAGHTGGRWGRGGDLLYRWGNPQAYRRGRAADQQLFGQHSPTFIPPGYRGAGNIVLFNNQLGTPGAEFSEVWEIVPPLAASGAFVLAPGGAYGPSGPLWTYADPALDSDYASNVERLPNGNTLICSSEQGWLFEVTPGGQLVWQHMTGGAIVFHVHYYEHSLWTDADTLSISSGGTIGFDLLAGSAHAGATYLMLGSVSGTSPGLIANGLRIPLNFDGWFATTAAQANMYPLGSSSGTLDAVGHAQASFSLPGGVLPPAAVGLRFDHAYITLDRTTLSPVFVSNPMPFELVP